LVGQQKVNGITKVLSFLKLMKRPQTTFYAHTMSDSPSY